MDHHTYNRNVWTTNGYLVNRQSPTTPGGYSVRNAATRQIPARTTSHSGHNVNDTNNSSAVTRLAINQKYPSYNSNFIGVQSKFRRKYYHKVLLGSLLVLIIILVLAVIFLSLNIKSSYTICRSKECLRTAASLIYAMDEQTDPCEDFYQFTCGRWSDEHPKLDAVTSNDWFRERQAKVMRTLREFLKTNVTEDEPEAVGKAKTMYKACINIDLLDERELDPLVHFLREFKLPLLPSGLNITLSTESATKYGEPMEFNWLHTLVMIKKLLSMDLIIGFDVFPDPLNRTINRIAMGTPETESALPFNNDEVHKVLHKIKRKTIFNNDDSEDDDDVDELESAEEESAKKTAAGLAAYVGYVAKLLEVFVTYVSPEANTNEMEDNFENLAMQAIKVARRIYRLKDAAENSTKSANNPIDDIVYISINDLQEQTDKLIAPNTLPIWRNYLELIMNGTNGTHALNQTDFKIITSQADIYYLQNLVEYLWQEPAINIEFYVWLSTVEELILHTTSEMRLLHSEYMRLVVGTEGSSPRSIYCAHGVNTLMGMAVSYVLADDHFTLHKLPNVKRMLLDIRKAFDNLVRATSWMDVSTKHETLQKSAQMKSFIGYPEWIKNASALNEMYAGVVVNASTHLENMIGVLRWQMYTKLNNLNEPEPTGWATAPSNVNAFHTFQSNAITIPIAILQYPFYDLGLEALNYGSIGTILGHELTHGFDDSGRMFDKNGNMLQWWSNETISEYVNRTECFVDQYSHYYLSDIGEYINGELTLGENIADNGGMREAFNAYRLYVADVGEETMKLPGLEQYTHEQLFFISFGNLWCETYTPAASRYALEDSHCPGKIRLKGVLTNSQEFATTFNCRKGTGMNPNQAKCRIW